MSTMWSVKTLPNPGSFSSSARSASDFASEFFVTCQSRSCVAMGRRLIVMVFLVCAQTVCDGRADVGSGAGIGSSFGQVGDDRRLDPGRGVRQTEVVEQQRDGEDRGGGVRLLLTRDVGSRTVD